MMMSFTALVSALALSAPPARRDGHGAFCTTSCAVLKGDDAKASCEDLCIAGKEVNVDWKIPMDGDANYIKVKVGDRIKFTWDGNHDVTWMGDVSDCDTMASKPPTVPGYDSSPFTMLALPDWDGAVVSFGCSVGGHCGMGQNMQIQFGDEVDKALSKGVCKGGAPLFNVAPWSKVDAKFAACSVWDDPLPSLAGLVTSVDDLSTLLTAVSAAGLVDTLSGDGTFTVFAPNNKAFAAIPEKDLTALLADKEQLKQVILNHVLAAQVLSSDLKNGEQKVETASGGALWVTKSSDGVTVANSDRSIVANVITADNMANNGVAHIIDAVLLPPSSTGDNDEDDNDNDATDDVKPSLAGLVTSVDDLSTLLAAVSAAGLVDTLSGDGTFTVFAPNNKAFAAIPEKNLTALLADKDQLKQVILYHVLASQVLSTDLKNGEQMVETASGGALWVTKSSDGVTVANSDRSIVANVITADNMANNGVAHIIDAVLLPPSSTGDNDDAAVTKTSTPTTVEDDDDVIDRDVVFDAFSWSDDCEKGGCPGNTGLTTKMENAFVQHYKEFYYNLAMAKSFSSENAAKAILSNPSTDSLNFMDASGDAKWFGRSGDDDDDDEAGGEQVLEDMATFFDSHKPGSAGEGDARCTRGGDCGLKTIRKFTVKALNAGLVLSTAHISFTNEDGAAAPDIKATMISSYNGTANNDAIYSKGQGAGMDSMIDTWHALSIWHEFHVDDSMPSSQADAWKAGNWSAVKDTLSGYYDEAYLTDDLCVEDCNKNILKALGADFSDDYGTAFQYIGADKGTFYSEATANFDDVVDYMDKIDVDMRTAFKSAYFYPSPLTQRNIVQITDNVVRVSQVGYYLDKLLPGEFPAGKRGQLQLLKRNLAMMLKDRQITVHQDFFYGKAADGEWKLIALATEEVKHIVIWPGMTPELDFADDSNLGYVEKAAIMFYLEETFGHFTRGEVYAAAGVMMQRGLEISMRLTDGFRHTHTYPDMYRLTTVDSLADLLADFTAGFDAAYTSVLGVGTVKRLAGGMVLIEAELTIFDASKSIAKIFDFELVLTSGGNNPGGVGTGSAFLDTTEAKSWQIASVGARTRAEGSAAPKWNQDATAILATDSTSSSREYELPQVDAWVAEWVTQRNKALSNNQANKEKNFETLVLDFPNANAVYEFNGRYGINGGGLDGSTALEDTVAALTKFDEIRRETLGPNFLLHLEVARVAIYGDSSVQVTCVGGYNQVPSDLDDDDDEAKNLARVTEEHVELDFLLGLDMELTPPGYRNLATAAETMISRVTLTNPNSTAFMHWNPDTFAQAKAESAYTLHLDEFLGHLVDGQYYAAAQAGKVPDHALRFELDNVTTYVETNAEYRDLLKGLHKELGKPKSVTMDNMETLLVGGYAAETGMSTITFGTLKFMADAYTVEKKGTWDQNPVAVFDVWMVSVTPVASGMEAGNWQETTVTMRRRTLRSDNTYGPPTYPVDEEDCSGSRRRRESSGSGSGMNVTEPANDDDGEVVTADDDDAAAIAEDGEGVIDDVTDVKCVAIPAGTTNGPFGGNISFDLQQQMVAMTKKFVVDRNAALAMTNFVDIVAGNKKAFKSLNAKRDGIFATMMAGDSYVAKDLNDLINWVSDDDFSKSAVKVNKIDDSSPQMKLIRVTEGTYSFAQPWQLTLSDGTLLKAFIFIVYQTDPEDGSLYASNFFTEAVSDYRRPIASSDGKRKGAGGRAFGYFILVCVILIGVGYVVRTQTGLLDTLLGSSGAHSNFDNDTSGTAMGEFANPLANPAGGESRSQPSYDEPSVNEDSSA